jgi:nicotinate-nucleotide adenylyltransferase
MELRRISWMTKDRIGVFGGTFNPIHTGHVKAARIVQGKFLMEKILFVPSYIPPHKESAEIASPFHRLKMVELALASYPRFIPSSVEIDAREKSYSIITLKKIKKLFPEAFIFFILGIDAFSEIDTWKDWHQVLEQCFFVVISRPGHNLQDARKVIEGKYKKRMVGISPAEEIGEDMFASYKIFLFPMDSLKVSSTEIRKRIKTGISLKGMVPEEVEIYIHQNGLYRDIND